MMDDLLNGGEQRMKEIRLTDKQYECLKKTIGWQLYWRGFVLEPNTKSMLLRMQKNLVKSEEK